MKKLAALLTLIITTPTSAATIGYWRMERDDDPDPILYSIPNEVPGGAPLVGEYGGVAPDTPSDTIPLTGAPNLGALSRQYEGIFDSDYTATVGDSSVFDLPSITIEFFARTNEGEAPSYSARKPRTSGVALVS